MLHSIDSTETLILGGYGKNGTHLKSSEVISANGASKGIDLPVSMVGHCSMKLSESIVLLGGGFQDGSISSKMYYLDLKTMEFTPGPSMQTARTGMDVLLFISKTKPMESSVEDPMVLMPLIPLK